MDDLDTEFCFALPRGLRTSDGQLHQQGKMRLATARDELVVQKSSQVRENSAYASLVMLAQVIVQLGSLQTISLEVLEDLFSQDLAYLKEFYNRINQQGNSHIPTQCPNCQHDFDVALVLAGES